MKRLLVVLLSLAAFVWVVVAAAVRSGAGSAARPDGFTTHIGARVPPIEAGCLQIDDVFTDEGKRLSVYACPPKRPG